MGLLVFGAFNKHVLIPQRPSVADKCLLSPLYSWWDRHGGERLAVADSGQPQLLGSLERHGGSTWLGLMTRASVQLPREPGLPSGPVGNWSGAGTGTVPQPSWCFRGKEVKSIFQTQSPRTHRCCLCAVGQDSRAHLLWAN